MLIKYARLGEMYKGVLKTDRNGVKYWKTAPATEADLIEQKLLNAPTSVFCGLPNKRRLYYRDFVAFP